MSECSDVVVERLPASAYSVQVDPSKFVDVFKLEAMFETMFSKPIPPNLILLGPKGIAKSLSLQAFAAKKGVPVIVSEGSEDVRRSTLVGMNTLRGDQTPFILGDVTTAIEVANEAGAAILVFEEINALTPQVQKILNPLCDFRRKIAVPEAKRVFALKPGAKLWVVGTMNGSVYGGVYSLNEDLKSRFRILPLSYPSQEAEKAIIAALVPEADAQVVKGILTLAHDTRQNSFGYALSTRDVVQMVEDMISLGVPTALRLASGKYEETDRDTFAKRAQSVFGKAAAVLQK